eukprot:jgi/Orpsp1_1/1179611/evm.model.c7180000070056.1
MKELAIVQMAEPITNKMTAEKKIVRIYKCLAMKAENTIPMAKIKIKPVVTH